MKKFILLKQLDGPMAQLLRLMNPPDPGCGCVFCNIEAKPNAPVIVSAYSPDAEEFKRLVEEAKRECRFVALVSLETDICFVYKAEADISVNTDLMILSLGSYMLAAGFVAHKQVDAFAEIVDSRGPVN
jgi:hypothetical protein